MLEKCEFCEKWGFEIVNFMKNWDFRNVNLVKNEILEMWILSNMRFSKSEFLDKLRIFALVCMFQMRS